MKEKTALDIWLCRLADKVAWRLPRKVVYFCLVRAGAVCLSGANSDEEVTKMTFMELLDRWSDKAGV